MIFKWTRRSSQKNLPVRKPIRFQPRVEQLEERLCRPFLTCPPATRQGGRPGRRRACPMSSISPRSTASPCSAPPSAPWSTSAPPANVTPAYSPGATPPATWYVRHAGSRTAPNPAGTPTAALLFRFTPGLPGTQSGGWSFLAYKILPTPPNTGRRNLGTGCHGHGSAQQSGRGGVAQRRCGDAYGNFIAGLPGSVPQAAGTGGKSTFGIGRGFVDSRGSAPIVTAAEARWESAGLIAAQMARLQGLQFLVTGLTPGMLGEYVPGVVYLDPTADGWGWFVDPTPGKDEEYATKAGALAALPGSGRGGSCRFADGGDARDGPCARLARRGGWFERRPDGAVAGDGSAALAQHGGYRCGVRKLVVGAPHPRHQRLLRSRPIAHRNGSLHTKAPCSQVHTQDSAVGSS